ncbi:MAG: DUF4097 family beta strand repeat protein [Oscillospiraceae bacterium]|nr:DUF4097 family beta strand repeat protein [Oscillospiraceae bacterium]
MKKGLKILLIVSAVLIVAGMSLIVTGVVSGAGLRDVYLSVGDDLPFATVPQSTEETVEIIPAKEPDAAQMVGSDDSIVSLDIDWISGSVEFVIHEEDHFGFSEHADVPIEDAYRMVLNRKGNTLEVDYTEKIPLIGSVPTKHLTVYVPASKAAAMNEIRLSVTSAEVMISGISADKLIVSSVSGDVQADNMTLRYVSIGTTSGEVWLTQEGTSCTAEVNTTSGNIDLSGNYQELDAETTSGEVSISLVIPAQELEIDTTSGDVRLQIPADMSLELEYESVSGDFKSDLPMSYRDESYVLNGGGAEYEVSTVSGDLTVSGYVDK